LSSSIARIAATFVAVMMIGVGLGAVEGVAAFAVGAGDEHCSHALVREQTVEAARGARSSSG